MILLLFLGLIVNQRARLVTFWHAERLVCVSVTEEQQAVGQSQSSTLWLSITATHVKSEQVGSVSPLGP